MNHKKLTLNRTTLRQLQSDDLTNVAGGGAGPVIVIQQTRYTCPGPSLPDPTIYQTIGTSGTSVINPSGGIVIRGH
jgi:hypothetical protein